MFVGFCYSVARLLRLLTCYNPNNPIAIGERYGFRTWNNNHGYNYLTGGGGVVLSAPLVHRIIEPGICSCPSATTPDDMYLFGACLLRLGYIHSQPVHSPLFHQVQLQRNIEVTVIDQWCHVNLSWHNLGISSMCTNLCLFFLGTVHRLRYRIFGIARTCIIPQILDDWT